MSNNKVLHGDVAVISSPESKTSVNADKKKYYIESYGCQMNMSDSEIVAAIMKDEGMDSTDNIKLADVIFLNTCSIRDKAEKTIYDRLKQLKGYKRKKRSIIVGILGCMAERLKTDLLEKSDVVDIIAGPDSYRDLPKLIQDVEGGQKAVNVLLSREETYADISPVRYSSNGVSAFVTIMRGCDNMCSFCVVPYTRGRERSRPVNSILHEVRQASENGYKEITLLGQNVDSYRYSSDEKLVGKKLVEAKYDEHVTNFAELLELVAQVDSNMRVRFSTSHPKDMTDDVFHVMKKYDNICKYIHLPVQSGSSSCLERMKRTYDRKWYLGRIEKIREIIPECAISSDIIAGFCGETEDEHKETLSLMELVKFDLNYMFYYSERPGTYAAKKYADDVPLETKKRRLQEIIDLQHIHSKYRNQALVGTTQTILVEYTAKRSKDQLIGRTDSNKKVLINKGDIKIGDYVDVRILDANNMTLIGEIM